MSGSGFELRYVDVNGTQLYHVGIGRGDNPFIGNALLDAGDGSNIKWIVLYGTRADAVPETGATIALLVLSLTVLAVYRARASA